MFSGSKQYAFMWKTPEIRLETSTLARTGSAFGLYRQGLCWLFVLSH
jgi:hypothetical protein